MNQLNLRKHRRLQLTGKVFIHDQEHIFIAPLNNVSRGGVFVDKLVALDQGHPVKVVIKSADLHSPLQASGIVVRVESENRKGSAIQFNWIDSKAFEQLPAE